MKMEKKQLREIVKNVLEAVDWNKMKSQDALQAAWKAEQAGKGKEQEDDELRKKTKDREKTYDHLGGEKPDWLMEMVVKVIKKTLLRG